MERMSTFIYSPIPTPVSEGLNSVESVVTGSKYAEGIEFQKD